MRFPFPLVVPFTAVWGHVADSRTAESEHPKGRAGHASARRWSDAPRPALRGVPVRCPPWPLTLPGSRLAVLRAVSVSAFIRVPDARRRTNVGRWRARHLRFLPPSAAQTFRAGSVPSPVSGHSIPRRLPRQPTDTTGYHGPSHLPSEAICVGPPDSESVRITWTRRIHVRGRRRTRGRTQRDTEISGQHYVGRVHPLTTRDRKVYRARGLAGPDDTAFLYHGDTEHTEGILAERRYGVGKKGDMFRFRVTAESVRVPRKPVAVTCLPPHRQALDRPQGVPDPDPSQRTTVVSSPEPRRFTCHE